MRVFTVRETMWANAVPSLVWGRLVELERWPDWNPSITAASWRGKSGFIEGHRFRLSYPGRARPFSRGGRIERVEAERELHWSDTYLTLRVDFELKLGAQGSGTEVDFASQFSGFGARFVPTDSFARWLTQFQREFLVSLRGVSENVTGDRWSGI